MKIYSFRYFWLPSLMTLILFACKTEEKKITPELLNFPQSAEGTIDQPLPVIDFDSIEYHFGTIAEGEKVLHSFEFTNSGKAPLIISQVEPACGCTTLKDWSQEPILPGDRGKISVEFNSAGKPGLANKTVYVQANTVPATTILAIVGEVRGPKDGNKDKENPVFAPGSDPSKSKN